MGGGGALAGASVRRRARRARALPGRLPRGGQRWPPVCDELPELPERPGRRTAAARARTEPCAPDRASSPPVAAMVAVPHTRLTVGSARRGSGPRWGGEASAPDEFRPASFVCRASAGPCDVPETCTGSSAACPADGFAPASQPCRGATGPCDNTAFCTGTSPICPPNSFKPATQSCRAGSGPCDPADFCTGSSAICPDQKAQDNTTCGLNQVCCNGICCGAGLTCVGTGGAAQCVCDPFERCGPTCPCPGGTCSPTGICIA